MHGVSRYVIWGFVWATWFAGALPTSAIGSGRQQPDSDSAADLPRYVPSEQQITRGLQINPRSSAPAGGAFNLRIAPRWSADGRYLWYRNDLADDRREFVMVDTAVGERRLAFNHERLAAALSEREVPSAHAERLPFREIGRDEQRQCWVFRCANRYWSWNDAENRLEELPDRPEGLADQTLRLSTRNVPNASTRTGAETHVTVSNQTTVELTLFWCDANGARQRYGTIAPGQETRQHTFAGHVWEIVDERGQVRGRFIAAEEEGLLEVRDDGPTARPPGRATTPREARPSSQSPDGRWSFRVRDDNVFVSAEGGEWVQVSFDGSRERPYELVQWAPDSQALVAFRVTPALPETVHLLESSPPGGGRARLRTNPYHLPGDPYPTYEWNIFSVESWQQTKPDIDPMEFGRPRLRWYADGRRFRYRQVDRGHQRFRLIEVDCHSGATRHLIDERSDTFIWTAHGERPLLHDVGEEAVLYSSEKSGWNHLYWLDVASGTSRPITQGAFVVRGIDRVDEERRQIWFRASGVYADQDPYFIHHFRVSFDGDSWVALTEGNGTHSLQFSPDRRFYIDTYSRPDAPPVHELRRAEDGELVCHLESADISQWLRTGGQMPEVFNAKGRDGETDIWGVIWRPVPFDPQFQYPVIEDIYAGPHDSHVPKAFSASRRYADLTDLGFVVVKIDGMGTANRSKAFHDVCWQNLKDAGFPDRRLWHAAAAAERPWYDARRVGIYGTSAGGQNAAGAVIFHGDFYRAAMAACGCHDNRMDKSSWNEQWMGYPVGPHYAESSNIDNAHRLQGKLLLIVGELDTNVPPESTYRLVDALIKAGKDFEFLMIPGMGHSDGGPFGRRKTRDFFIRTLHGIDTAPFAR